MRLQSRWRRRGPAACVLQVIGSAAMLGGVTRMTISITLLAMEGTGSLQLIIPLMLAIFAAKIAGDALTLPIYDIQIKIRGAPVLVRACCHAALGHDPAGAVQHGTLDSKSGTFAQSVMACSSLSDSSPAAALPIAGRAHNCHG